MVLPFQPLSLCFSHMNYYVDIPAEMKSPGVEEDCLQLLRDVSGSFKPGILIALMGVSGAGRIAWLRLSSDIDSKARKLLLMKRGGKVIYGGPIGHNSHKLKEYFEYALVLYLVSSSGTWDKRQKVVFVMENLHSGFKLDRYEIHIYPNVRFYTDDNLGYVLEVNNFVLHFIISKQQDLFNLLGAMYAAELFLGASNATYVQPSVSVERMVFYREKVAGMYSTLHFAFAQVPIKVICVIVQTFMYSLILYSMIGFVLVFLLLIDMLHLLHNVQYESCCIDSDSPNCYHSYVFLPEL
ncbi:hypothetical protein Ddye_008199 [Dipteronia dyeriana]|uniref:ABC-2 type transporter transmembrane domain-containing protein n=1 Tax=Dipteronia dyeriana TaxID=168575 RepID=A0AAD9X9D4_9ROSI|nr:hypothetical protein Ddye_008199 [Dipteronia dyeriana]